MFRSMEGVVRRSFYFGDGACLVFGFQLARCELVHFWSTFPGREFWRVVIEPRLWRARPAPLFPGLCRGFSEKLLALAPGGCYGFVSVWQTCLYGKGHPLSVAFCLGRCGVSGDEHQPKSNAALFVHDLSRAGHHQRKDSGKTGFQKG